MQVTDKNIELPQTRNSLLWNIILYVSTIGSGFWHFLTVDSNC